MTIINLNEEQAEDIGAQLSAFDEHYISYKMNGRIRIGMEDGRKLIAGLDAEITAFRILYVSTVFVDEAYRRKGIGARLVRLGIDKGNPQSAAFWKKNGFAVIREVSSGGRTVLVAERKLS